MRPMLFCVSLLAACVRPVTDPHAAGANQNIWRATVARAPGAAFDAAMRVLTDSSYKIADARKDAGMIKTEYRKESEVQRGMRQARTMAVGSNYPVKLQLVVLPQGTDSSTITITGEYMLENIGRTLQIGAREGEWRFIRGIGEAILATK